MYINNRINNDNCIDNFNDNKNINFLNYNFNNDKIKISKNCDFKINSNLFGREIYEKENLKLNKTKLRDSYLKIMTWNCRHLNNNIKKNFVKKLVNTIQPDIIYLIDADQDNLGIWRYYDKYFDNKNTLYIRNEIQTKVNIEQENYFRIIDLNISLMYIKPNLTTDEKIKWNVIIHQALNKEDIIIGDLNLKSNSFIQKIIFNFNRNKLIYGEHTSQIILIAKDINQIRKEKIFLAPSDHKLCYWEINKKFYSSSFMKLNYIKNLTDFQMITNIFEGKKLDLQFNYKVKNVRLYLNDKYLTIRKIVNLYLRNNPSLLYKYFNNVWSKFKKEPLLGDNVPNSIIESIKIHLKHNKNKEYKKFNLIEAISIKTFKDEIITKAKDLIENNKSIKKKNIFRIKGAGSHAKTEDFIGLKEIGDKIKIYIENLAYKRKFNDIQVLLYKLCDYCNNNNISEKSKVFYLIKNSQLKTFQDVRLITILPTTFRMFEALIYDEITTELNAIINKENDENIDNIYQFGGLKYGGTIQAINFLKYKIKKNNQTNNKVRAIFVTDIAFGYDSVNLEILDNFILNDKRLNERTRKLLLMWNKFNKNMDLWISNDYIQRTIGIPMGAALSPAIFIYYVDVCLLKCDFKKDIIMYIDDLSMILKELDNPKLKIQKLKEYLNIGNLSIKEKKTFIITDQLKSNQEYDIYFKEISQYKIMERFTFLGRDLIFEDNNIVPNDENIIIIDQNRIKKFPSWLTLSEHRLLFLGALQSKQRFISFMMSIDNKTIRIEHLTKTYNYFRNKFDKLSYRQLMFNISNMFRFYLDSFQLHNLLLQYKSNIDIIKENNKNNRTIILENTAIAYTDGSFNDSYNNYGAGSILIYKKNNNNNFNYFKISSIKYGTSRKYIKYRNVAGEILAVNTIIEKAIKMKFSNIIIYFDYEGIEKWTNGQWQANNELTLTYKKQIMKFKEQININFIKVKAHSNIQGNNEADNLAKKAILIKKDKEEEIKISEQQYYTYIKDNINFNDNALLTEQDDIIKIIKNQIKFNHKELDSIINKLEFNLLDFVNDNKNMLLQNSFNVNAIFTKRLWSQFKLNLTLYQFEKYDIHWEDYIYIKDAYNFSKLFNKHAFLQDISFFHLDWFKKEEYFNRIILWKLLLKWKDYTILTIQNMPEKIENHLKIDYWLNNELDNLEEDNKLLCFEIMKFNKNEFLKELNDLWKFLLDLQYSRMHITNKNKNKKEAKIWRNRLYKLMWNNSRKLIYNIDKLWYNKSIIIKPRNELILELLILVKENKFVLQIISECENIEDNEEDIKDLDIEDNILEDQNEIDEYMDESEQ